MCGRYGFSVDVEEVRKIIREVERRQGAQAASSIKTGEIFPTNTVPILTAEGPQQKPVTASWGFQSPYRKGVIINARAETAGEKRMFRGLLVGQRCIVPTTGFFEWSQDESKQKYLFRWEEQEILYLAGLYQQSAEGLRFVILTTGANQTVADIHNRMPVLLPRELSNDWLHDPEKAAMLLSRTPEALIRQAV